MAKVASKYRTRAFSYRIENDVWFSRLAREARRNSRSISGQLVEIIKYYFDHKKTLRDISKEVRHDGYPDG